MADVLDELQENARGFETFDSWFEHIKQLREELEEKEMELDITKEDLEKVKASQSAESADADELMKKYKELENSFFDIQMENLQLKKELEEELEESGKNQKDYQQLCTQIDRLAEQTAQLQKEKELLETQIRQSAAKELGGRYLKAQNLRTRIERIEKEYEKYAIYQSVDLQEIDQTQKRMAAKAQINRTMEKYRRASQEVEHRIQELNTLYRTLEVSEASEEVLEQFESVYERYLTLGQMGQEIKEMMIRQRNIAFHRSRLNPMDEAKLREDIQTWRQLQQQKIQQP